MRLEQKVCLLSLVGYLLISAESDFLTTLGYSGTTLIITLTLSTLAWVALLYWVSRNAIRSLYSFSNFLHREVGHLDYTSYMLASYANRVSKNSDIQAEASQECVSAMLETQSMIKHTRESSHSTKTLANSAFEKTSSAKGIMGELNLSMNQIVESGKLLDEIIVIIDNIKNRTEVINDIVFKTQLLAFNASIEAERAGEHGRGFAVVAQEVNNLANSSGKAAEEITSLLQRGYEQAQRIVNATRGASGEGLKVTQKAVAILEDISSNTREIKEQIGKIDEATNEQTIGVEQTTKALSKLDSSIQGNAEIAHESKKQSADLVDVSHRVESHIRSLRVKLVGERLENEIDNVLDHAGRQRMLSQKMVKELLLFAANINPEDNLKSLATTMQLFSKVLKGLQMGDEEFNFLPAQNSALKKQLRVVETIWEQLKPLFSTAIQAKRASSENLMTIYQLNPQLLQEADKVVKIFEELKRSMNHGHSQNGHEHIINVAGKQRMLVQKLAKEYLFYTLQVKAVENRQKFDESVRVFNEDLKLLIHNDTIQKEKPILAKLHEVHETWNELMKTLNDNSHDKEFKLKALQMLSAELLRLSNEAVMLIKIIN